MPGSPGPEIGGGSSLGGGGGSGGAAAKAELLRAAERRRREARRRAAFPVSLLMPAPAASPLAAELLRRPRRRRREEPEKRRRPDPLPVGLLETPGGQFPAALFSPALFGRRAKARRKGGRDLGRARRPALPVGLYAPALTPGTVWTFVAQAPQVSFAWGDRQVVGIDAVRLVKGGAELIVVDFRNHPAILAGGSLTTPIVSEVEFNGSVGSTLGAFSAGAVVAGRYVTALLTGNARGAGIVRLGATLAGGAGIKPTWDANLDVG